MRSILRWTGIGLAAGLALAIAAWVVAGLGKTPLDAAERTRVQREGLAHDFVALPDGVAHYRLAGPEGAPVVVLIHGFANGFYIWDDYFAPLAAAGHRVLALDLFGRGFSDRPRAEYGADLYDRQIVALLDALGVQAPVDLVGNSMGGAIVAEFVARHAERTRSAVFIAPAGLGLEPVNAWLTAPLLGDWLFRVVVPRWLERSVVAELMEAERGPALVAAYHRQAAFAGYEPALLSTARHFPLSDAGAAFDAVGRSGRPVLAVWGTADRTVPFALSEALLRRVPQTSLRPLDGQTHAVAYAQPGVVLGHLLGFLDAAR
jgi:pimeloyl-ACP methyl ester carboxylesterase